ncbi:MAG TPA: cupin domain-containing protein [Alphaproteobacteria bacterium]|nr:cupin domain-containing protein [Alphaproteobacteria bacterium]
MNRIVRLAAVSATLIGFTISSGPASATPGSGFAPSPVVNGHFGKLSENTADEKTGKWGMILKTLDDTDIGADRLVVQPGGFSGWHAHPSPVYVTVTSGSIVWYDGSDPLCTAHTYSQGESFIEGTNRTHNVQNVGSGNAEFVAIVIKPAGFEGPLFRLDRAKPNNCNF